MECRLIRLAAVFESLQSPVGGPYFTEGQLRHGVVCPSVPKASHRQCWSWGPDILAQWLEGRKGAGSVTCQCSSSLLASSSSSVLALCHIQSLSPCLILFPPLHPALLLVAPHSLLSFSFILSVFPLSSCLSCLLPFLFLPPLYLSSISRPFHLSFPTSHHSALPISHCPCPSSAIPHWSHK